MERGEPESARARLGDLPTALRRQNENGAATSAHWANLGVMEALLGHQDAAFGEYGHLLRTPFGSAAISGGGTPDTSVHVMKLDSRYAPSAAT